MHEGEAHKDIFGDVPLAKRVKNWIEKTDAGMEIDVASALLSVVTVVTYMVSILIDHCCEHLWKH